MNSIDTVFSVIGAIAAFGLTVAALASMARDAGRRAIQKDQVMPPESA